MAFDRSEVEKIAHLARLHISDAEADEVTSRITDILALIDKMQSVDTTSVEPLAHPLDVKQRLRADRKSPAGHGSIPVRPLESARGN